MDNNYLADTLKDVLESLIPPELDGEHPPEALSLGTFVRSIAHDKLGVIIDSFYGDVDKDNQKIIVYTVLLFPNKTFISSGYKNKESFYISNEYEYDIVAYLMLKPLNIKELTRKFGGII